MRLLIAGLVMMAVPDSLLAQDLSRWEGSFRGNCQNLKPGVPPRDVDFTMERSLTRISGSNRYAWKAIYNGGAQGGGKNYQLIPVDPSRGIYQMDEGEGVLISTYLAGDTFYSHFKVAGVQLTTFERLVGDQLVFEILSFDSREVTSGAEVSSYRFQVNQRCVMRRI